jgi:hypothetical protein
MAQACRVVVESLELADLLRLDQLVRMVCPVEPERLRSSRIWAGLAPRQIRRVALHSQPRADATRADRGSCKRGRTVFFNEWRIESGSKRQKKTPRRTSRNSNVGV